MKSNLQTDNEFRELWIEIWSRKWFIFLTSLIVVICAVFYALSLPNIYKSEALLAPVEENNHSSGGLASQFGGLAAIAGINLSNSGADKLTLTLEVLKSRAFLVEFLNENNFKPIIMAANGWNMSTNTIKYNRDIYDLDSKTWQREIKAPKKAEPSDLEVFEFFIKENLSINKDKETGLVLLSVKHFSPYVAKEIVDKLILAINKKRKQDDIAEANKSIEYLRIALKETVVVDMQKIFYQLIEQQEQTKMLASVREQYVLKVIDPAIIAENKHGPKRAVFCILALLFGVIFSLVVVMLRFFYSKHSN
ncbi:LPS O-antigen length regulator [Pseudoalteromonas sp. NBT06-2]|nr:LPS O-antigen length regulator [Pseudoalteromonas sp. NBT06-2]